MDEAPNSAPACPEHPGKEVVGTCPRCGRFGCGECLPGGARLCPACAETTGLEAAERRAFTLLRGLALGEAMRAVMVVALVALARESLPPDERRLVYIGAAVTALPFAGLAVAIWTSGRPWLAWLALALDLVVFGGMASRATHQPLLLAALLALPVAMAVRVVRLHLLNRRIKGAKP